MNKTFYGYIRVSTARQGERGVSLQEQRASIERFAAQRGITISRWFEERETAAKTGRPIWNEMLRLLRKKSASGVVIHKIDRGVRNGRDWVDLTELVDRGLIELYFANEQLDLTNRGGRLSADLQAVVAADYIRNLREEALKGINGRLKQGILPLPAPIGYLDCGAGKPKAIDPVKGPLVRRALIGIERIPSRLSMSPAFGVDVVIDLDNYQTAQERISLIADLTNGAGADVVVDTCGASNVLSEGLAILAAGGSYLEVGNIGGGRMAQFDPSAIVYGQKQIIGCNLWEPNVLAEALNFLHQCRTKYPLDRVVGAVFDLAELNDVLSRSELNDHLRIGLRPWSQ